MIISRRGMPEGVLIIEWSFISSKLKAYINYKVIKIIKLFLCTFYDYYRNKSKISAVKNQVQNKECPPPPCVTWQCHEICWPKLSYDREAAYRKVYFIVCYLAYQVSWTWASSLKALSFLALISKQRSRFQFLPTWVYLTIDFVFCQGI